MSPTTPITVRSPKGPSVRAQAELQAPAQGVLAGPVALRERLADYRDEEGFPGIRHGDVPAQPQGDSEGREEAGGHETQARVADLSRGGGLALDVTDQMPPRMTMGRKLMYAALFTPGSARTSSSTLA